MHIALDPAQLASYYSIFGIYNPSERMDDAVTHDRVEEMTARASRRGRRGVVCSEWAASLKPAQPQASALLHVGVSQGLREAWYGRYRVRSARHTIRFDPWKVSIVSMTILSFQDPPLQEGP